MTLSFNEYLYGESKIGEKILVIGGASSGTDLAYYLSNVASRLTLAVRKKPNEPKEEREMRRNLLPKGVTLQESVKRLTANGAEFADGTRQNFTVVFFATGKFDIEFYLIIELEI